MRERVVFTPSACSGAFRAATVEPFREAAILSTCNRTELYCARRARAALAEWLAGYHSVATGSSGATVYTLPQADAVRHASASPRASTPWCWASRRSSGR